MKTNSLISAFRQPAVWVCAGFCSLATLLGAAEKKAVQPENHIDISVGSASLDGSQPAFQKALQTDKSSYGIEDLFVTKALNDTTALTLRGQARGGSNDFLFDLKITKDDVGYLKLGYKGYRVWFNGLGGYYPPTGYFRQLYDEDLHMDRGNLWFEAAYTPEDQVNFILRYDLFTRRGKKDSTSWGDTSFGRYILPSFHKIDETRHQVTATLSQKQSDDNWELGVRYDKGDYSNSRNERRRAGDAGSDRYLTQKAGRDYDLFQIRGSYVNTFNEKLMVTTAVANTKIDSTISGTRIYGPDYDPVFDPAVANRQYHDEGFYGLHGDTQMKQTIGTISALYQPDENWFIVPSFRMENIDWDNQADFAETAVQANKSTSIAELASNSQKSWMDFSETIEARYKGIKDVVVNFKAEWVHATGDLTEKEIDEPGTPAAAVTIDRDTEFKRNSQKYSATANWYLSPGTTLAVQYYYKGRQNDYKSPRDSTAAVTAAGLPSGDRYPANIANQDFETNDFNVRLSLKASSAVRLVTRYDYQKSRIRTQDIGGSFGQSANMTSHIIAETVSVNPLNRWYLQGTVNYVWDQLTTPATQLTGAALNRVRNSDANYLNFTVGSGYVVDENTDLYVDYSFYNAFNDFSDNSDYSVAYGTKAKSHMVGVTWFRQIDSRTALTLRYAYAKNTDSAIGNLADYEAHMIYGKIQYRF